MNDIQQKQLGDALWSIADKLRGAMNADDFRDYMLSFLFLRYLSDNYETSVQKELGKDYTDCEKEIENVQSNGNIDKVIAELKLKITTYFNTLPISKLPIKEDETDNNLIQRARQTLIDEYESLLESQKLTPLSVWYINNLDHVTIFEKQMRKKIHFVIKPHYLWSNIYELSRTQNNQLLKTLQAGFKFIENESFDSTFHGLFSEVNLDSDKLGKNYQLRNEMLCSIITEIAEKLAEFTNETDLLGNAYEYLIGQFASETGKKAGEFYTPHGPAQILCRIALTGKEEKKGLQVYDPCMGSGSLMLSCRNYSKEPDYIKYYG